MPYKSKEKVKDYQIKHRKRIQEKQNQRRAKLASEIKSKPCTDCGNCFPPECMDFDHVRGKKLCNVAAIISSGKSDALLYAEIAKCDLVCANCHRIRTRKRKLGIQ